MRKYIFVFAVLAVASVAVFFGLRITAEKPVLTVYTYDSFAGEWGPGPQIKTSFEAKCDCTVNYVATADSVAMLAKVLLEDKGSKADVLVGLDTNLAARARQSGLFAPHQVTAPEALSLPVDWQDTDFVPFDWGVMAFIYNQETLPNPPKSFADLENLPDTINIALQDPRTSTPGYSLLLWLETLYPERTAEIWQNMRPHILTFTKGWWDAYSMYLEGQADLVLSYTTSPAYHIMNDGTDKHKAAAFSDGHIAQIELAGALAHSDHLELAREFLAHLQSKEVQEIIPTTNWMFPIRNDVTLPEAFQGLITPESIFIADPEQIEPLRKERIARWQNAVR